MSGLLGTLRSSAGALMVFEEALSVIQNNVTNSSTPGYARQRLALQARRFDPERGLTGGVSSVGLQSSRDEYSEAAVRRQQQDYGRAEQQAVELARLEPVFDITAESGIAGALNKLFQVFTAWTYSPGGSTERRSVIDSAGNVALQFNAAARSLTTSGTEMRRELEGVVDQINTLVGNIRELNANVQRDFRAREDAGWDARLQTALEELSGYVDFTAIRQEDGSVTVLLGGQTPLVMGQQQYVIEADMAGSVPALRDQEGRDITAQVTSGRLSALLEVTRTILPSMEGDLNRLAATVGDRINAILAGGVDPSGDPGAALFTYTSAETAAATLAVTAIDPAELAAAGAAAPGGNDNALILAGLIDSPEIDGESLVGFYGMMARRTGEMVSAAQLDKATQQSLLVQARAMRQETSAVSLDEEAIEILQFQSAYQAAARLVTLLDELTETTINLLR